MPESANTPATPSETDQKPFLKTAAALALPLALAAVVHHRVLSLGFIADDLEFKLAAGSLLGSLSHFALLGDRFIRPLPALFWWFDRVIWGDRALGYHLTNLILFMTGQTLLFTFLRKRGLPRVNSSLATMILAALPVTVGAVAWPAARFDLLCLIFGLAALIFQQAEKPGPAALALAAALLCKEMAAVFVLFLVLIETGPLIQASTRARARARLAPGLIVAGIYAAIRIALLKGVGGYQIRSEMSAIGWLSVWLGSVVEYVIFNPGPWGLVGVFVVALGLVQKQRKPVAAATAALWAAALPVVSILPHDTPVMNMRLMLVPAAAFAAAVGIALPREGRTRAPAWGAVVLMILPLSIATVRGYDPWSQASARAEIIINEFSVHIESLAPASRIYAGRLPAREAGIMVIGNGLDQVLGERALRAGSPRGRVVSELSGIDDEGQMAGIDPSSFDRVLFWDDRRSSFIDRTDTIREALAARKAKLNSGLLLAPIVLEDVAGPHLFVPLSGAEGWAGTFVTQGSDAALICPRLRISAWMVDKVEIVMAVERLGPSRRGQAELYFAGAEDFSESNKIAVPVIADGELRKYAIEVSNNLGWLAAGDIERIRFDPIDGPARVRIQSFALVPFVP